MAKQPILKIMNKFLKLLSRLSGGLLAVGFTGAAALEVVAQPSSPAIAAPSAPPITKPAPNYSFFQGLTFSPFPGTIPRPAFGNGNNPPPVFPLVEVSTPGLIAAKQPGTTPVVRRRKKLVISTIKQPARRLRRVIPRNQ
jgi:hypothetical protein